MKKAVSVLIIFWSLSVFGQQEPQYTQYMYNTVSVNPGYAGTRGATSLFGLHRSQWVGLDGAPRTTQFSIHSPISYRGHGLGLSVVSDNIGPSRDTYVNAGFSYLLQLSHRTRLNLGLMAGGSFLEVDYNKLNLENNQDPDLTGKLNKFSPNVGVGAYLHSDKWYVGLSVPALLETRFYDDVEQSVAREKMHFYLIGGYVFDLGPSVKFKPATLVKAVNGAPLSVDLSANFLLQEKLTLGAAYRWDAAVSALAGFNITESLFVGYAYDWDTNGLGNYNSGSHEVFLRFEFISSSRNRMHSPRFF
ncbi:type IX secretion system membrane protein PorP/SprF [Sinomicrobium kalidii]|uniref:PorP/SprF family type IX secretion system membrane protein n=1 Tax=Sinomicrobium kalidii TaxID=2900738 RepID=UPI001E2A07F9|nr:type IX secretion system membrane protein PorP/SprF [Sinomicrobium kalidii]UGU16518.1 type IX secretion system membrane protein PorP/SprF [Sinomicrobium kalidii]